MAFTIAWSGDAKHESGNYTIPELQKICHTTAARIKNIYYKYKRDGDRTIDHLIRVHKRKQQQLAPVDDNGNRICRCGCGSILHPAATKPRDYVDNSHRVKHLHQLASDGKLKPCRKSICAWCGEKFPRYTELPHTLEKQTCDRSCAIHLSHHTRKVAAGWALTPKEKANLHPTKVDAATEEATNRNAQWEGLKGGDPSKRRQLLLANIPAPTKYENALADTCDITENDYYMPGPYPKQSQY